MIEDCRKALAEMVIIDEMHCRKALAEMVIIDEMPFRSIEGEAFRRYSKVLQPGFDPPSRITVARDYMQRYIEEKPKLKKILKNHRICLTTYT